MYTQFFPFCFALYMASSALITPSSKLAVSLSNSNTPKLAVVFMIVASSSVMLLFSRAVLYISAIPQAMSAPVSESIIINSSPPCLPA